MLLFYSGPHQPGKEGLQCAEKWHHPSDFVQPVGNRGQDVRGGVRPLRHAALLTDVPQTAHTVPSKPGKWQRTDAALEFTLPHSSQVYLISGFN